MPHPQHTQQHSFISPSYLSRPPPLTTELTIQLSGVVQRKAASKKSAARARGQHKNHLITSERLPRQHEHQRPSLSITSLPLDDNECPGAEGIEAQHVSEVRVFLNASVAVKFAALCLVMSVQQGYFRFEVGGNLNEHRGKSRYSKYVTDLMAAACMRWLRARLATSPKGSHTLGTNQRCVLFSGFVSRQLVCSCWLSSCANGVSLFVFRSLLFICFCFPPELTREAEILHQPFAAKPYNTCSLYLVFAGKNAPIEHAHTLAPAMSSCPQRLGKHLFRVATAAPCM